MFFHISFSSVRVSEWPPFGKELTICSPCILTICNFSYLRAGFGLILLQFLVIAYFLLLLRQIEI